MQHQPQCKSLSCVQERSTNQTILRVMLKLGLKMMTICVKARAIDDDLLKLSFVTQAVRRRNGLATFPLSNCIRIWCQKDYSCTRTSHEYWIMHVIFDCSHVIVRTVQACCCCQQASLQAYIGWLLLYLSSVDVSLAVDSLSLTDVNLPDYCNSKY